MQGVLSVGVNIAIEPVVQILLKNMNSTIVFSSKSWSNLLNEEFLILNFFTFNSSTESFPELNIDHDVVVKFINEHNKKVLRFVQKDQILNINEKSYRDLVNLQFTINFNIKFLNSQLNIIKNKMYEYSTYICFNDSIDMLRNKIINSASFNSDSAIDCELVATGLKHIINHYKNNYKILCNELL